MQRAPLTTAALLGRGGLFVYAIGSRHQRRALHYPTTAMHHISILHGCMETGDAIFLANTVERIKKGTALEEGALESLQGHLLLVGSYRAPYVKPTMLPPIYTAIPTACLEPLFCMHLCSC